ncbi:MAG: DUF962 domain-containing protein [Planctomycetales bacterium]|nr:DUF962 domain-containing protein [Planctomycetales bacterium]
MAHRTLTQWLDAYAVCHQNSTNKLLHWICVPAIAASLLALLWTAPVPWSASASSGPQTTLLNWAVIAVVCSLLFYMRLSLKMAAGMLVWSAGTLALVALFESLTNRSIWPLALVVFVVAWIGQFIGHKIEGKKPAFFEDLQYLLIGPLWVLDALGKRLSNREPRT